MSYSLIKFEDKKCDRYNIIFFHPKPLKGLISNEMG